MPMLRASNATTFKKELNQLIIDIQMRADALYYRWHNTSLSSRYRELCVSDLMVFFDSRLKQIHHATHTHNLHEKFADLVISHVKGLKRNSNDVKTSKVIAVLNEILVSRSRKSFDEIQFDNSCETIIDSFIQEIQPILAPTDRAAIKQALFKIYPLATLHSELLGSLQAVMDQQEAFKVMLKMVKQANPTMTDVKDIIAYAQNIFEQELEIATAPLLSNVTRLHAVGLYTDFTITKVTSKNYQAYLVHLAEHMSSVHGVEVSVASLENGLEYRGKRVESEFELIQQLELIRQNQDVILLVLSDFMREQNALTAVEALNNVSVSLSEVMRDMALEDPKVKSIVKGAQTKRQQGGLQAPREVVNGGIFEEFDLVGFDIDSLIAIIAHNYYPGEALVPQKYTDFKNDFKTVLGGEPFSEALFTENMQKINDDKYLFIDHLKNSRDLDPDRPFTQVIELAFQNFTGNHQYVKVDVVDSKVVYGFSSKAVDQQVPHLG